MKKTMLFSVLLLAVGSSIFGFETHSHSIKMDANGNGYVIHDYEIQEDTFNFIESFCGVLRSRYSKAQSGQEPFVESNLERYNFQNMESDLKKVGNDHRFSYQKFQEIDDYEDREAYIVATVIRPSISQDAIFIAGEKRIQVKGKIEESGEIGSIIISEYTPEANDNTYSFSSALNSPLFKASCAATATGLVTYYAVCFYNKDKAKERQLSKLKWSLGAALVIGAGTYWYVR